jgi:hypothetical protein
MPEDRPLKMQHDIHEDGSLQSEVIERGTQNCQLAVTLAEKLGTIESDERTGPDCDRQEETVI